VKKNNIYLMTILLVDDSKTNTALLRAILDNEGFEYIHVTHDKESTLQFLKTSNVDLILISSFLSGYSGLHLCEDINHDLRYENIPILMVTADAKVETLRKSFESGAVDYISKPINSVELFARVQAHLIRKEILYKHHQLAITDQLTSLYNRRHFETIYEMLYTKSKKQKRSLIFFMIDIDNFKKYNDNYGHQMGDVALQKVSKAMKSVIREDGDYLFRLGGEEFAIILLDNPTNYYEILNRNIHKVIKNLNIEHNFNESYGRLSVSIGICKVLVAEGIFKFDIYNKADEALYTAKEAGRNQSDVMIMI